MKSLFFAAFFADLLTYVVTSIQLGIAYPATTGAVFAASLKFMGIFAITQIPLAIIEGIITVVIMIGLETYAKPELKELKESREIAYVE